MTGELAAVIERIMARKRAMPICSTRLAVTERGQAIGLGALQKRFPATPDAAGLAGIRFRDLRAKAATDKADASGDIRQAQRQLGHASVVMTEHNCARRESRADEAGIAERNQNRGAAPDFSRSRRNKQSGGEGGIRTHGTDEPYTGFRVRRIRPLCHLSAAPTGAERRARAANDTVRVRP
ncbi:phage-related integrase [Mizugakiibacter sediminis]|uniref:Phage-related integrase n=1 Tax=Mizugakiibacter sediminis TaxID=1475481 RepID=A0A0K8QM23_9GAMM|nr:phage-related integrase [Mizugakiibacter sediminis]